MYESSDNVEEESTRTPFDNLLLDEYKKDINYAVGQPCTVQSDGGSPGDAGNSTTTAKNIGSNPTTSFLGCADTTDTEDYYEFTMDENYNIQVEMSNYANDYDMGLAYEDNGTFAFVSV